LLLSGIEPQFLGHPVYGLIAILAHMFKGTVIIKYLTTNHAHFGIKIYKLSDSKGLTCNMTKEMCDCYNGS
jgi:hypothetical protein